IMPNGAQRILLPQFRFGLGGASLGSYVLPSARWEERDQELHKSDARASAPRARNLLHRVGNVTMPVRCQMLQSLKPEGGDGEEECQFDEVARIGCHKQCPEEGISDESLESWVACLGAKSYR
ncbi:MAG TPA: hypothetical protein VGJ20_38460, partial [Xanthobacteraceae bacterium]